MKITITTLLGVAGLCLALTQTAFAQTNTFPATGDVGIGTTPDAAYKLSIYQPSALSALRISGGPQISTTLLSSKFGISSTNPATLSTITVGWKGNSGFGLLSGGNVSSPVVWMYPNSNAFTVAKRGYDATETYSDGLSKMVDNFTPLFQVASDGRTRINTVDSRAWLAIRGSDTHWNWEREHATFTLQGTGSSPKYWITSGREDFDHMMIGGTGETMPTGAPINILNGKVGIWNNAPEATLDVNGDALVSGNTTLMGIVGIGTTQPKGALDVNGNVHIGHRLYVNGSDITLGTNDGRSTGSKTSQRALVHGYNDMLQLNYNGDFEGGVLVSGSQTSFENDVYVGFTISDHPSDSTDSTSIVPYATANLIVNGVIRSKEVKVKLDVLAPDYVFAPEYSLRSLTEVEEYITTNNHLPDVTPGPTMDAEGVSIGELQYQLLRKVEELTLYTIQQQKELEALRTELQTLKATPNSNE